MIVSKQEIVEKYPNGNFKYIETRAVISPVSIAKYPNHRIANDGTRWVRIGVNKKFNPDGKLAWEIKYDNCGSVVK